MGHFDLSLFPSTFRFLLTVTSSLFQQIPNPRFNFNQKLRRRNSYQQKFSREINESRANKHEGNRAKIQNRLAPIVFQRSNRTFEKKNKGGIKEQKKKKRMREASKKKKINKRETNETSRTKRDKFYRYFQYARIHAKILYKNFNVNTLLLP